MKNEIKIEELKKWLAKNLEFCHVETKQDINNDLEYSLYPYCGNPSGKKSDYFLDKNEKKSLVDFCKKLGFTVKIKRRDYILILDEEIDIFEQKNGNSFADSEKEKIIVKGRKLVNIFTCKINEIDEYTTCINDGRRMVGFSKERNGGGRQIFNRNGEILCWKTPDRKNFGKHIVV